MSAIGSSCIIRAEVIASVALVMLLGGVVVLPSRGSAQQTTDDRSFLRCGGWNCSLTAIELSGVDSKDAWALGRTTKDDAEDDCGGREDKNFLSCALEQIGRPPVVITLNCEEGTASYYGGKEFQLSEKAKAGQLPHAQDPEFWQSEMSPPDRTTAISWFRLLCPKASAKWNVREEHEGAQAQSTRSPSGNSVNACMQARMQLPDIEAHIKALRENSRWGEDIVSYFDQGQKEFGQEFLTYQVFFQGGLSGSAWVDIDSISGAINASKFAIDVEWKCGDPSLYPLLVLIGLKTTKFAQGTVYATPEPGLYSIVPLHRLGSTGAPIELRLAGSGKLICPDIREAALPFKINACSSLVKAIKSE